MNKWIRETKARLCAIELYYSSSRGVGHTRAMIKGAKSEERPILISGTSISARNIGRTAGVRPQDCLGWNEIGVTKNIRGLRQPLVFDDYGIQCIIADALNAIGDLEHIILSLKRLPYNID